MKGEELVVGFIIINYGIIGRSSVSVKVKNDGIFH